MPNFSNFGWQITVTVSPNVGDEISRLEVTNDVTQEEVVSSLVASQLEFEHYHISRFLQNSYPFGAEQSHAHVSVRSLDETSIHTCLILYMQDIHVLLLDKKEAKYLEKCMKDDNAVSFNLGWIIVQL